MDEQIPDDYYDDPDLEAVKAEEFQAVAKRSIADYYYARYPHLREPFDPWIRTEGETHDV
jgi:hypothetical protein